MKTLIVVLVLTSPFASFSSNAETSYYQIFEKEFESLYASESKMAQISRENFDSSEKENSNQRCVIANSRDQADHYAPIVLKLEKVVMVAPKPSAGPLVPGVKGVYRKAISVDGPGRATLGIQPSVSTIGQDDEGKGSEKKVLNWKLYMPNVKFGKVTKVEIQFIRDASLIYFKAISTYRKIPEKSGSINSDPSIAYGYCYRQMNSDEMVNW